MSRREDISADDRVVVYLDTFHDGQRAYYFSANPLGIQSDGIQSDSRDNRFDAVWHADGQITPDGYAVFLAIPFKSLRFSSADKQRWGIALGRTIVRNSENSFWPFITKRQSSFIQQLAVAEGLSDISSGHDIQLIPYGAYTHAKVLDPSVPRYQTQTESRAGMDAKVVFRNLMTLDLTVNPDFSQVESDDPQVTVNKRFEVFFPEKRPFFLENVSYFETPLQLLFTRRIADPEFGARLTGKFGRWNLGLLSADDRAPGMRVDADSSLSGDRTVVGVGRLQREIFKDSNIGILATERRFGSSNNRMYSADMKLRLSPTWYFNGQAARSDDRSYDKNFNIRRVKGSAYSGDLSYAGRQLSYGAKYLDLTSGFRAPLGFVQRVDVRKASQYAAYYFYPESSSVLTFGPSVSAGMNWDHTGQLLDKYSYVDYRMDFAGPVGFTVTRYDAYESYLARGFRYHTNSASFYASWIKGFTFYGDFSSGTGVNYSTPDGVEPFVGRTQSAGLGFSWRPTQRMRFDQSYYFDRFRASSQSVAPGDTSTIFTDRIARTKVSFQVTKALSLRVIGDYYFLSPNTALFDSDRYEQLTGDFLLTYLLHPGTALYVGYNGRYENLATDPQTSPALHRSGPPTYPTTKQAFVKLSYLFRF